MCKYSVNETQTYQLISDLTALSILENQLFFEYDISVTVSVNFYTDCMSHEHRGHHVL